MVRVDGSGIAGAAVVLTGSQNATFTTDATGDYNFAGVVGGLNYHVTIAAPGWTFDPGSYSFTNLSGSMSARDFSGTPEVLPEMNMTILPDGHTFLYWPVEGSAGWTLMRSTAMAVGSWTPVSATITQRGDNYQVILTSSSRAFFRLDRSGGGGSGDPEM